MLTPDDTVTKAFEKAAILETFNLSSQEYDVLSAIDYEFVLPPDELVTAVINESSLAKVFTPRSAYYTAIDSCITRGWLKILSVEDCLKDAEDSQNLSVPRCSVVPYRPGAIDFTAEGAAYFQRVSQAIGLLWHSPEQLKHVISYNSDTPGEFHIYSPSKAPCRSACRSFRRNPDPYVGSSENQKIVITGRSAITAIGPWWLTRWRREDPGYHAVIWYKSILHQL